MKKKILPEEKYNKIKKAIEAKKEFSWIRWAYDVGTPIVERIKKSKDYQDYLTL